MVRPVKVYVRVSLGGMFILYVLAYSMIYTRVQIHVRVGGKFSYMLVYKRVHIHIQEGGKFSDMLVN